MTVLMGVKVMSWGGEEGGLDESYVYMYLPCEA